MPVHYARHRGSKITVVIQTDAKGRYSVPAVFVITNEGRPAHQIPHEARPFEDEAQALRDAITSAEA